MVKCATEGAVRAVTADVQYPAAASERTEILTLTAWLN